MRPIDVARRLNLSTSALRNYEAQGIIPPALRDPNGYRNYTDEHLAYLECIAAMAAGYGMEVTSDVMRLLLAKDTASALWLVNEAQALLHRDRCLAEEAIRRFELEERGAFEPDADNDGMTIGEVAAETDVPPSTLRYWEKEGLIASSRDEQNGYRRFSPSQLRKIWLLRTLRTVLYSADSVRLKQAIRKLEDNDAERARDIAHESLQYLNRLNQEQLRGSYYLFRLCRRLNLLQ
ncbi:MerR family DNA-binding transcriptional regulator [Paenibacillus dendritiformis]|uniref:Transcriptional regulator n=1 Tax=Paenibacillus dendritiformis C454 TaxID=1131935 RepID=H3SLV9_9BACL|nr:MerR family DNA-binding transcriptional regulator [Paenibacillus dendritiformis]EHQ59947.1 transcriptional regulator [Paenibacillus dendritiformis C454]CAH8772660.1 MerR family DNA-binding transcriptional regulator [Paenibacillus dendritiformis]